MRISYTTTTQYTLPKSGTVNASKILFKILRNVPDGTGFDTPPAHSPSNSLDLDKVLEKYPGFPQAERLLYPRDICHRLATHLKESNTAYPFGVRVMTGLLTGWLRRDWKRLFPVEASFFYILYRYSSAMFLSIVNFYTLLFWAVWPLVHLNLQFLYYCCIQSTSALLLPILTSWTVC